MTAPKKVVPLRPFVPPSRDILAIDELAGQDRWVCWRYEQREGQDKPTKVPYAPEGTKAKSTTPGTWSSFDVCCQAVREGVHRFDGVGVVFYRPHAGEEGWIGIDLDKCRDPVTGAIEPWARAILDRLRSYTEVSVSGTGVHVIVRGVLPRRGGRRGPVEAYAHGRYFCTTGQWLDDWPDEIVECQAAVDWLWATHIGEAAADIPDAGNAGPLAGAAGGGSGEDHRSIVIAPADFPWDRFQALLDNDPLFKRTWERQRTDDGLSDQTMSSYDMALAVRAAQADWSNGEIAELLRAFHKAQGERLNKVGRLDYLQRTIWQARQWVEERQAKQGAEAETEPAGHVSVERFVMDNREAAAAYHGFGGDSDRRARDLRLAQLAGAAGLSDDAVRQLLRRAAPVAGVEAPADLEELVARARESRTEQGHDGGPLDLIRARLRAPVRRVVALIGAGERLSIVAFELELEDGCRVRLGDGDAIQKQNQVRSAFIKAGLPVFNNITSANWYGLIRAMQEVAEREVAGDLDDATRLAELLVRAMRRDDKAWTSMLHPKDGGADPALYYNRILELEKGRTPHPFIYSQTEGRVWVPWTFIDKTLQDNAHRSIERWSAQKATEMLGQLGWRGKQIQIVVPAAAIPSPAPSWPSQPTSPPSKRRVVRISAWSPPAAVAAEFEGVADKDAPGDA